VQLTLKVTASEARRPNYCRAIRRQPIINSGGIITDTKELLTLIAKAEARGAVVGVQYDETAFVEEGRKIITRVQVLGLKGIGPYPMDALSAAERLREAVNC